ncbi:Sulfite oxidase [Neofusicoccum parvum]|nr:Sulfite oxidase [Neofusicoccum parvum]
MAAVGTQKAKALPSEQSGKDAPFFAEEREGWKGYIEWEDYPEKKKQAAEILARHKFPDPPEFQLEPLPKTNPVLGGERFKAYHYAMGPTLRDIPKISWDYVLKEKSPDMIHLLQFPYNGEPPRDRLVSTPITPNPDFFVRNHGGIPTIPASTHTLDIDGLVAHPQRLTLADLQDATRFPRASMVVTLQCSGTRRAEQIAEYPGDGDELINAPWGEGAIGTARWTGVSLKRVIKHCGGLRGGSDADAHIEFYGADTYFKKGGVFNYVVSVPWRKVRAGEVLLAWEMNGRPLPAIHGAPLRVVVAGYIGARSVKWLYRVRAIEGPSLAPVQMKEYLYYPSQVGKQNAAYSNGFSIQDMPVSSAIMSPREKEIVVHEGKVKLRGWAYSGGGRWPVRVEVSGDGGSVWYEAPWEKMSEKYFHAWRLWEVDLPVEAEGWLEFCVRCWDNALNTQPTFVRSAWNWDLHVTSSCHRIKVYSINKSRPATAERLKFLEEKGIPITPITRPLEIDLESEEDYLRNMKARGGRDPVE